MTTETVSWKYNFPRLNHNKSESTKKITIIFLSLQNKKINNERNSSMYACALMINEENI